MTLAGASNYLGAALAVYLFDVQSPWIVAWLRVGAAGIILVAIFRPKKKHWLSWSALAYGLVTLGMNTAFYEAIDRIPLGMAVAIEFIGPIAVAAWGSRTVRDWLALIAAAVGVVVLSGTQWGTNTVGIIWIIVSGVLWGLYILASDTLAHGESTFQSMGVGLIYASAAMSPFVAGGWNTGTYSGVGELSLLIAMAFGLGLLSAVIPYGLDLVMLKMASPDYYAVLLSLLPVTAAVIGMIVLGQLLTAVEVFGILLIVVAVALRKQTA
ncbi:MULTISPECIES: DMT family transporter [Corynebacterium]|uniref:EamA family transporter n=1 Tax=Corynebacterium TaxID=1716 RepID=UPI0008A2F776|nr:MULTISPECIES: EamA family transporter [Corynebacterium]MCT1441218.1 EamA family transporter [Corynebacterium glucuronolyticum]MCT1562264.1 EamA family transporter [Corynebacterium glucuronolyticum]OFO43753.1 multidrug DMT transporter permease [Corynebacterium sp. HMSC073D01]